MLGAEIRMVELLGLVEHVLAEHAFVEAGRRDRAHVMERARADRRREIDRVTRALDVRGLLLFGRSLQVVDGREMEEMVDLALELSQVRVRDAELRLAEVADDRDDLALVRTELLAQRSELLLRSAAHQRVDRLATLVQVGDQEAADEAGGPGDEVGHALLPFALRAAAWLSAAAAGR
jgi:hypothetical protein